MAISRRTTPGGRRPARHRSTALLALPVLATLAVTYNIFSWWPVELSARRANTSAVAQRRARELAASGKRALDYMLEFAARESPSYPQKCRERYHGLPFLQTINASWQQPVCTPQASGPLNSSLSCWFQFETYAEAYCTGANLALDLAKFEEEEASIQQQASNRNADGGFTSHHRPGLAGELLGDCDLHGRVAGEARWQAQSFGKGGQEWLHHSFKSSLGASQQPVCVEWLDHPLYFLNDKYDSTNVWHALEDITHAFEAYAVKGWGREAQVVVMDQVTPDSVLGPTYLAVWNKAFSPLRPPVLLRQLARDAAARAARAAGGALPPGAALCLRDVFFNVHGGISLLSRSIGDWTECVNSTTVNAMVAFLLDALRLSDVRPASHAALAAAAAAQAAAAAAGAAAAAAAGAAGAAEGAAGGGNATMRVLWALRSNRAGHQKEVLAALQQRIPAEAGAEVLAVDFGGLSIEEQIWRVRQADVLAGYHGAALTLALYMPGPSGLVEIEESFRCRCYTNCALWRSHPYALVGTAEVMDDAAALASRVVEEVKKLLGEVAQRIRRGETAG